MVKYILCKQLIFVTGFAKTVLGQFAQKLKFNLMPYVNDTLMHCPETLSTWL